MKILCVDIGGGTQDICIYSGESHFENAIKMVLHTPAKYLSNTIKAIKGDLFISGSVIGGGELMHICKARIDDGFNVFISQNAAKTLRDDLDRVKSIGVTIVEEVINPNIIFDEFDYELIKSVADKMFGDFSPDMTALAAQDHGYIKGQSDRVTRFAFLKTFLKDGLSKAFFSDISQVPDNFSRWKSLAESAIKKTPNSKYHISDTAIIAALGAASVTDIRPIITIDAGNCHTFAALIGQDDEVFGFFEHHTHVLDKENIKSLISKLSRSEINNDEVFNHDGHGAHIFKNVDAPNCPIFVTGPNRERLFDEGGNVFFANPKGDTMMTGPIGLLIQAGVKF